ncbi:glycosyltransferase family 90 protein [Glonium stellatum]|uniref:Glycosyltransferase family 90 protein n=1 Tax=Glonium stellatum TaxID=574774 RepID=A0A8E2ERM8_9PEZI|nr:glycosyltransferase family 90 protein [Glonium stellatum]
MMVVAYPIAGRPARKTRLKLCVSIALFIFVLIHFHFWIPQRSSSHPVDTLIKKAQTEFNRLLSQQTSTIAEAASAYRIRRGRHPPPGFEIWYNFAKSHNTVIIEEFWDQIHDDLAPFWGVPPEVLRDLSRSIDDNAFHLRNGTIKGRSNEGHIWMGIWWMMLDEIASYLPDLDMAMNIKDESRVLAPWETVQSSRARGAPPPLPQPLSVIQKFSGQLRDPEGGHDFFPLLISEYAAPTLATDACYQPHLAGLHGTFIRPLRKSISTQIIPMFSSAKLSGNNDILVPGAMYYAGWTMFEAKPSSVNGTRWEEKQDAIVWRGHASGGINTPENWNGFQRHRFLAMVNSMTVAAAEKCGENQKLSRGKQDENCETGSASSFRLPDPKAYNLHYKSGGGQDGLNEWVRTWAGDTGFTNLMCHPREPNGTCNYTSQYYSIVPELDLSAQINKYRYLPDIDGNSFSGRWRGFLLSSSVPMKATIYREWHDKRLVPWVHFVPLDNAFIDIYGVMEYFVGHALGENYETKPRGHNAQAKRIAEDGKVWAEKVLRKEDMLVYVMRLLLEWARVSDPKRARLGYVGDLLSPE